MKLIRYQGELSVSGTNVLMKLCLEKQRKIERVIERTEDRHFLKALNKLWWKLFFFMQRVQAASERPPREQFLLVGANQAEDSSQRNAM